MQQQAQGRLWQEAIVEVFSFAGLFRAR